MMPLMMMLMYGELSHDSSSRRRLSWALAVRVLLLLTASSAAVDSVAAILHGSLRAPMRLMNYCSCRVCVTGYQCRKVELLCHCCRLLEQSPTDVVTRCRDVSRDMYCCETEGAVLPQYHDTFLQLLLKW